jgi:hypothetical protein
VSDPTAPDRLQVAAEIADMLAVPESWVRENTRGPNAIPHYRLGRYVRYDPAAVLVWLADQREGRWRKHRPEPPAS